MKIAISQPTYLPWQGYFALIDYVDEFIFLENIQFNKRSWQQRNKIINNGKEIFLTVPVKSKGKFNQNIFDVELDNYNKFKKKQILSIKSSYSKCRYFDEYFGSIEDVFNKNFSKLVDLNKELILNICKIIGIKTTFSYDRNFNLTSKNKDYLKDICLIKNCSNYISTLGAKDYFGEIKYFPDTKININYFDFIHEEYPQKSAKFISKLSIIDLVFNLGPDTLKYLKKNFYICV